jgi:hypothetical protein
MIGIAAIAAPLAAGPPCVTVCGCGGPTTIMNPGFWMVAAIEVSLFAVVSLNRHADALRRELDNPPDDDSQR